MALEISLAAWSFHRTIEAGRLTTLDLPRVAREELDIDAIELVNVLMEGRGEASIDALRRRAADHGVRVLLIMCDDEGDLCDLDASRRRDAVRRHCAWIDAAAALGATAVRVNTGPETGAPDLEAVERCAASCRALTEYGAPHGVRVLVENHGGISSRLDLLLALLDRVPDAGFGTLPDFGNFPPGADIYGAVEAMMPRAGAVSAKCYDFDDATGEETTIDFARMLGIVRAAGYDGALGIEYEGERLDELEGVRRAKALLERLLG